MLTHSEFITQTGKVLKHPSLACVPAARSQNKRKSSRDSGVVCDSQFKREKFFLNKEIYAISLKDKLIKPSEENMRPRQDCLKHSLNWTDEN